MSGLMMKLFPHRRASELFDARIDAVIEDADAAFLDAHLDRCAECREAFEAKKKAVEALRALGTAKAPVGFAGRVMMAAKARKRVEVEEAPARWSFAPIQQFAAAAFVVAIGVGAIVASSMDGKGPSSSSAISKANDSAVNFVVRAPGIGVAKLRSHVTATLDAHKGTYFDNGNNIVARIPRGALIGVTQELASRGPFKMTKAEELLPDAQEIVIRFEIE